MKKYIGILLLLFIVFLVGCSSNNTSTKETKGEVKENVENEVNNKEQEQKKIDPEIKEEEKSTVEEAYDLLWNKARNAGSEERVSLLNEVKEMVDNYSSFKSEYKVDASILFLYAKQSLLIQSYRDDMEGNEYNEMGEYDNHETYGQKFADKHKPTIIKYLKKLNPENDGAFLPPEVMSNFKAGLENFFYITEQDWINIYNDKSTDWVDMAEREGEKNAELRDMKPQIGMTSDEVIKSKWGKPKDINRTTTENGTSEQWVYPNYKYVYLEDNKVTAIQD